MRIRLFFSALALTLLLLLPMIGLVEYFAMQRQMQERVRRVYLEQAALDPCFCVIECTDPDGEMRAPEAIFERISARLSPLF